MHQGKGVRRGRRDGVVIRDDHFNPQGPGPLQCLRCCDAVVDGDKKIHTVVCERFDHPWVQPITVVHATWDGSYGPGSQRTQGSKQQGCAGHAIGVVVPADGNAFVVRAGFLKSRDRVGEIWEMVACVRELLRIKPGEHLSCVGGSPSRQDGA